MRYIAKAASIMTFGTLAGCMQAPPDQSPPVIVKEITSATTTASGQPIRLPQENVRVVLSEYMIAPGAKLPVHKHPFARLAVVQAGSLSVTNQETNETITYAPGDLIVEALDQWHFAVNAGVTPVRLLVLDEMTGNGSNTVLQH
jgi:quercetin dioxygenase-like cupin family protein